MTASTLPEPIYTRGRLVLDDADEAWLLLDALAHERQRLLIARGEMLDEGIGDAISVYNVRLKGITRVRKRLKGLMVEKGWGNPEEEAGE